MPKIEIVGVLYLINIINFFQIPIIMLSLRLLQNSSKLTFLHNFLKKLDMGTVHFKENLKLF
jgi:hypothetical protein